MAKSNRLSTRECVVDIPRFTIDGDALSITGPLSAMGICTLFDKESCDLGRASAAPLFVEDIIHKTFLCVDEAGTEAAAATAAFAPESKPPKRHFCADHPFLFLLRERRDGHDPVRRARHRPDDPALTTARLERPHVWSDRTSGATTARGARLRGEAVALVVPEARDFSAAIFAFE